MSYENYSPKPNQKVSILFKNGKIENGIVLHWSDGKSVLKSLSSENIMIIQQTLQDVMAVKVYINNNDGSFNHTNDSNSNNEFKPTKLKSDVYVDKKMELDYYEPDPKLRAMGLAELRLEQIKQEKELARKHMFTLDPSKLTLGESNYVFPTRIQQTLPSAIANSTKKNSGGTGEGY